MDIEDEIYSRSGVRDDMKRDGLARAITGTRQFLLTMKYNCRGQNSTLVSWMIYLFASWKKQSKIRDLAESEYN